MKCSNCKHKKKMPLYSKCAGIPGRNRVGTVYYCGHPDILNPVPLIKKEENVLKDCPLKPVQK